MSEGSCGCRVDIEEGPDTIRTATLYCPLHAPASEMLAALDESWKFMMALTGQLGSMAYDFHHYEKYNVDFRDRLQALIARAEGKG